MKIIARALALVAMLIVSTVALAGEPERVTGYARVIDGDTLRIGQVRIRLAGIDAPERDQTCETPSGTVRCGEVATAGLRDIIADNEVRCERRDTDRYGRMVAICWAGYDPHDHTAGVILNSQMVRLGLAIDYARYSHGEYAREEAEARRQKLGVWSSVPGGFVQPETWRREHRGSTYRSAN